MVDLTIAVPPPLLAMVNVGYYFHLVRSPGVCNIQQGITSVGALLVGQDPFAMLCRGYGVPNTSW